MRHRTIRFRLRHVTLWGLSLLLAGVLLHAAATTAQPAWSFFSNEDKDSAAEPGALSFISDIYADISPAVVGVDAMGEDKDSRQLILGSGSGVIFDKGGYIITNNHVVEGATELTVSLADGRTAPAQLIGSASGSDLALLRVELDELPAAVLGDSTRLKVGDVVFPIGNPGGQQFARSMTMGLISGIDRQIPLADGKLYSLLQTDAAINPGNSGGPLVDCQGRVIGINSVKIVDTDYEGMGFAIPINTVKQFIGEQLPGWGQ